MRSTRAHDRSDRYPALKCEASTNERVAAPAGVAGCVNNMRESEKMIICHAKYCINNIWNGTDNTCVLDITTINNEARCHNFFTKRERRVIKKNTCHERTNFEFQLENQR